MAKLTVDVDLDLTNPVAAGDILSDLRQKLGHLETQCYCGRTEVVENASGIIVDPRNPDDEMVGSWKVE